MRSTESGSDCSTRSLRDVHDLKFLRVVWQSFNLEHEMRIVLATLLIPLACVSCTAVSPGQKAADQAAVRPDRWEAEIAKLEKADRENPPPPGAVVFVGSSSVRRWKTLKEDFPGIPVINHGFGGSRIADCTRYIDRIVVPCRPRMVVLYAGDNDLAGRRTPTQVFEDYREFVEQVRRKLPGVPIAYISIKPSPARRKYQEAMREANEMIRAYVVGEDDLIYIDVFTPMLGPDGTPRPELFVADRLHLSKQGYDLWREIVAPHLK